MYTCDVCGKALTTMHGLRCHKRIHTGERPYKCDMCGKAFIDKRTLSRHILSHTKEKPYTCDVCGKGLVDKHNLRVHMGHHAEVKPYSCDICPATYVTWSGLSKHKRTHSDVKEFVCEVCKKGFHRKSVLQAHMAIHTGERPYVCKVCGQSFKYDCGLRYHMVHHFPPSEPIKCPICQREFLLKMNMRNHVRRVHEKKGPEKISLRNIAVFFTNKLRNKRNGKREDYVESVNQSDVTFENSQSDFDSEIQFLDSPSCDDEETSTASSTEEKLEDVDETPKPNILNKQQVKDALVFQFEDQSSNTVIIVPQDHLPDFIAKMRDDQLEDESKNIEAQNVSNLSNEQILPGNDTQYESYEDETSSGLNPQSQSKDILALAYNEQIGANMEVMPEGIVKVLYLSSPSASDSLNDTHAVLSQNVTTDAIKVRAKKRAVQFLKKDVTVSNDSDSRFTENFNTEAVEDHTDALAQEVTVQYLENDDENSRLSENSISEEVEDDLDAQTENITFQYTRNDVPVPDNSDYDSQTEQVEDNAQPVAPICQICYKRLPSVRKLNRHMRIHLDNKPITCTVCDKRFNAPYELRQHMFVHTGNKPYQCTLCPKSFTAKCHLKYHFRVHTGERPFECNVCKQRFMKKQILKVHMLIHTSDKPYVCKMCQQSFKYSSALSVHMRSVHTTVTHLCKVCNKTFKLASDLKRHSAIHSEEKPYECAHCSWSFRHRWALERHKLLHSIKFRTDKKLPCPECGKKYSKGHICGQKLVCDLCDKTFDSQVILDKHLNFHARRNPYFCFPCKASFIDEDTLKEHNIMAHGADFEEELFRDDDN